MWRAFAKVLVVLGMASNAASVLANEQCTEVPPRVSRELAEKDPPMQYCFSNADGVEVLWLYGGIGSNSFNQVAKGLRQVNRYREIRLNSGGGQVDEGFKIGRELKRLEASVVVPAHSRVMCASACTMLMLGAYNRTVEQGASFYVHAKSGFLTVTTKEGFSQKHSWDDVVNIVLSDTKEYLAFVGRQNDGERQSTYDYLVYLIEVIGGTPDRNVIRQILSAGLPGPYDLGAPQSRSLEADLTAIRISRVVALQEILTQVELRAMELLHARLLLRQTELGRGGRVGLRLYKANLACRIQDVCLLDRHQLESLGFHNFTPDRAAGSAKR